MTAIYEPRGKAREYAALALNLYRGCAHNCAYCYAPSATYATREAFAQAQPRPGIIPALQKQLASGFRSAVRSSGHCRADGTCRLPVSKPK